MNSQIQGKVFKHSKYTPLPFLALMLLYREPNIWSLAVGIIVTFVGELIRLWGSGYSNANNDNDNLDCFVITGPYAYLRYPHYLGNILLYFGMTLMSCALFPYLQIAVILFFFLQYKFSIRNEENSSLGSDLLCKSPSYADYYHSVGILIPSLKAYRSNNPPPQKQNFFSMRTALEYEAVNIKAYSFIAVTLIIIWFIGRY